MDVLVRIVDVKTRQDIEHVSLKKEVLLLVLQNRKFKHKNSKYDIVEFIPDLFEDSILVVDKKPLIY